MTGNSFGRRRYLFAHRIEQQDLPSKSLVRALDDYWRGLATQERLPSRADIDPIDINLELLPWIFLMDVLPGAEELDYKYRLAGTRNAQLVGRDVTGFLASAIFDADDRQFMMQTFHTTVRERKPTYWQGAVPHDRHGSVAVYRAIFPLSTDGVKVDMLIGAAVPDNTPSSP